MKRAAPVAVASVWLIMTCPGCAWPAVTRTPNLPLTPQLLSQLWVAPSAPRNLAAGVGGNHPRPAADARYEVLEKDTRGFSITYRVRDQAGAEWNVKIGPEAQPEVVSSRIVWGLGYHQVPSYFVERWVAVENGRAQTLGGARFRPRDFPLDGKGPWSWHKNPFVGTREYNGLLALMMLINSTDLKDDNNERYEVEGPAREGTDRWYVVKDLGATLGETGRVEPRRGYLEGFEREPFISGRNGRFPHFFYRGRHQELVRQIPIDDLHWMCQQVLTLSDRQWRDAFAAGNYDEETTARYVARIRAKAQEGLAVE